MDVLLKKVICHHVHVYLDDTTIFLHPPHEHIGNGGQVFTLLFDAAVAVSLKNGKMITSYIDQLVNVICPERLKVLTRTIDEIRRAEYPTTVTEIRSFLGLCEVYRQFVLNFACVAALLSKKLLKG